MLQVLKEKQGGQCGYSARSEGKAIGDRVREVIWIQHSGPCGPLKGFGFQSELVIQMASPQIFMAQMDAIFSGQSVMIYWLLLKEGLTQHRREV